MIQARRIVNQGVAEGALRFAVLRTLLDDPDRYEAVRGPLVREIVRARLALFPDLLPDEEDLGRPTRADREGPDTLSLYLSEIRRYIPTTREQENRLARALELARDCLWAEVFAPPRGTREADRLRGAIPSADPLFREILEKLKRRRATPGADPAGLAAKVGRVLARLADVRRVRSLLVARNLHLVPTFARRYRRMGVPYLDLIQEGNAALLRAADKFDWRRGFRFPSYAQWWIQQAILKGLYSQSRVVRVPVYLNQKLKKIRAASSEAFGETGRVPSAEELSEDLSEPILRVRRALRSAGPVMSIDHVPEGEEEVPLREKLADPRVPEIRDDPPGPGLRRRLQKALADLAPRERRILLLRFGLSDGRSWTLEEVSERFGVSRERIRQIQGRALEKLRERDERTRLSAFLG
jgi:RNA polymerase primary sigma factor